LTDDETNFFDKFFQLENVSDLFIKIKKRRVLVHFIS
jgi:hypothetical protein